MLNLYIRAKDFFDKIRICITEAFCSLYVRYTFFSAMAFGFATYIYLMCNNLHNYDNLLCTPSGVGQGITAGRWLIQLIWERQIKWGGGISFYNSTTINTLIAVIMLIGVCILLSLIFELKTKIGCMVISAITMTAPAIAVAMIFNFTVHIYAYSLFLITLGVFIGKKKNICAFIIGALLIGRGTGGYQAYISYAAVLFVILLIEELHDSNTNAIGSILNGVRYLALLVCGYIIYMAALKYYLNKFHMQLSSYQGIDRMGTIDIHRLPELIKIIYSNMILITNDVYLSFSIDSVVRNGIIISYFTMIICLILFAVYTKKVAKTILYALYMLILPIAFDAIEIMAPDATKYSLQSMSMSGIFYCPIIFTYSLISSVSTPQQMKDRIIKHISNVGLALSAAFLMGVAINYCYIANVNYTANYYNVKVAENYYITLYNQILCADGYSNDKEIVLIGGQRFQNYPTINKWGIDEIKYDAIALDINVYSKVRFMELYIGENFRNITDDELTAYADIINTMQVYPNTGSIMVVDDKVLVMIAE